MGFLEFLKGIGRSKEKDEDYVDRIFNERVAKKLEGLNTASDSGDREAARLKKRRDRVLAARRTAARDMKSAAPPRHPSSMKATNNPGLVKYGMDKTGTNYIPNTKARD